MDSVKLRDFIETILDSTQKVSDLINGFTKVAGYKVNIQKSAAFPNTNNKISEKNKLSHL